MDDRHLPKLKVQKRGQCRTCRVTLIDIWYNRERGRWQRLPKRLYCSDECLAVSRAKGGRAWLKHFAPQRTLDALGL